MYMSGCILRVDYPPSEWMHVSYCIHNCLNAVCLAMKFQVHIALRHMLKSVNVKINMSALFIYFIAEKIKSANTVANFC